MSVVTTACLCEVIAAEVQKCAEHHTFWLNGRRLRGVTSVIYEMLPKDLSQIPPDTLDKAKHRGIAVDLMVSAYIYGQATAVPSEPLRDDVMEESRELFAKFKDWFDRQNFKKVDAQVTVHDDEIVGIIDILADNVVYDLKCTYDIEPEHHIQLAGYMDLNDGGRARLIHVTKRKKTATVIDIEPTAYNDWRTIRDMWRLTRRLSKRKSA